MFDNYSIIWLFDEANASFNAISFQNYLQIQNDLLTTSSSLTQTWQIWLWATPRGYCTVACSWGSLRHFPKFPLKLPGGFLERVKWSACDQSPLLTAWGCARRNPLYLKACQKYNPQHMQRSTAHAAFHSTCSIPQLRTRGMLDTLHPVPFLHLYFVSDV